MLRFIILLVLFTACAPGRAQPAVGVKDFFLDPVGRSYFLLDDDRLVTANQLGATTNSFYDSSLGSPDYVDVANPFQLLLYYREYGTVIVLDRTLSELDRIDLFANSAIQQPGAIARSYDNGVWVFDNWNYRLLRLDDRGTVDQQTNDLRLELNAPGEPANVFVGRNAVMLYFPDESRLAVFSNFGEFRRWVKVPIGAKLSWNAPYMLAITDSTTQSWSPDTPAFSTARELPETLRSGRKVFLSATGFIDLPPGAVALRRTNTSGNN